jgi:hypothetical protein
MDKFKKDLEHGQAGEELFMTQVLEKEGYTLVNYNNDYRWDIKTLKNNAPNYWEVKMDDKSVHTGNFYIECQSYGKSSGIMTSQSQYFVIMVPSLDEAYLFNTKKLREYLVSNKTSIVAGGDDMATRGFLINKNSLILDPTINKRIIETDMSTLRYGKPKLIDELFQDNEIDDDPLPWEVEDDDDNN